MFIETLLERADCAERRLLMLGSHEHRNLFPDSDGYAYTEPYLLTEVYEPTRSQGGRSLDGSTDDIIANKMQETIGNRVGNTNKHLWLKYSWEYVLSIERSRTWNLLGLTQHFLILLFQRSYSVSSSYRLGEQLHGHHRYRYLNTPDSFKEFTVSVKRSHLLSVSVIKWSRWTNANLVSGFGGLELRGGINPSPSESLRPTLDSTRERRRRRWEEGEVLVCRCLFCDFYFEQGLKF